MSNNLEQQIKSIRKAIKKYRNYEEAQKIDESIVLKKKLSKCKKTVSNYLDLIENADAHLSESPSDDKLIIDEKKFYESMTKINDIKKLLKDEKLTIDDKIVLYLDLVKYSNIARDYLDQKKEIIIKYIN